MADPVKRSGSASTVSADISPSPSPTSTEPDVLRRRLLPLYGASFLGALALWVPIEKLFMTTIGFDAASVGAMAAVYAVVVPVLEVPSGVLADRWSRRGVLILAAIAAIVSVLVGGFSQSVTMYMISAVFLGVFFALQSGTVESVVYDTVLEETGNSDAFERTIGRVRLVESVGLVASALIGGAIAEVAPLRATYFLTAPLLLASALVLLLFREPQLHKAEEREPLRRQIGATYRTIFAPGRIRAVVALTVVGALLMQGMLEFGPLWLVALAVPAFLYGPQWAGLTSALGLGGVLGGQAWVTRRWVVRLIAAAIVACGLVLALSDSAALVVGVQVLLTLLVVAVSIPVTRRLHDAVPSGDPRGRCIGRRHADLAHLRSVRDRLRGHQPASRDRPGRLAVRRDRGRRRDPDDGRASARAALGCTSVPLGRDGARAHVPRRSVPAAGRSCLARALGDTSHRVEPSRRGRWRTPKRCSRRAPRSPTCPPISARSSSFATSRGGPRMRCAKR